MQIDFSSLTPTQIYHWMTQSIVPRPIAWVISVNEMGGYNLAPFSYFNAVCSDPPLVMLSVGKKPGGEYKDTSENLIARKNCVIHIAKSNLAQLVTDSSRTLPAETSEVDELGLDLVPFDGFDVPRLACCDIAMACSFNQVHELGRNKQRVIYAEVHQLFVSDEVIAEDTKGRSKIDALRVDPLARLGSSEYAVMGKVISIPRPK
ncbi:flavin reductase family protein [Zooshikella marina]|uniref:flavin reductase family protein n=1 Tax=Zooshikella ganghwensis TaxID=202772 RepID=UPI001BAF951A|nr:flavin reductase family protein [Zooshikella ganghwensis]MBU2705917.1 flavin reductase family protein [Zooshikella ganghwensis]